VVAGAGGGCAGDGGFGGGAGRAVSGVVGGDESVGGGVGGLWGFVGWGGGGVAQSGDFGGFGCGDAAWRDFEEQAWADFAVVVDAAEVCFVDVVCGGDAGVVVAGFDDVGLFA